ncbi:AI-2E family transporter [Flavobacterium sp.]|uniref:AI-2E family transporter n=1 Tax=Flavobacterium sp. TaxID=239 RepID=UPI0028BD863F|nr:AI-2E family transporter [Flavobacterium sp.]
MTSKEISRGIVKAVLTLAGITLMLFVLYKISIVIIYFLIAVIMALIGEPIVAFLKRKLKFNNTLAVIATLSIFFAIIFGFIMMFIPLIISQSENLSLLDTNSIEKNLNDLLIQINTYLAEHNIDTLALLEKSNLDSKLNFNFLPDILNSVFGIVSNLGMGIASVAFILFFLLKDKAVFKRLFQKVLPDDHEDKILASIDKIKYFLSRYFSGILLQLFIVFILYYIVLLIFGVESAFTIAFICAILNIIPYIGPLIGTVLAVILTMMGSIGLDFKTEILPTALYVLIGFTIVQFIDNNFSQPIIFSNSLKSHPLEIFLITLISGFLLGITGMIIAIPTYTVLKVIGKEFFPKNKIVKILTKDI